MIQAGSLVTVVDKTSVSLAKCIKVLGHYKKRIAVTGDIIVISVQRIIRKDIN